MLHIEKWKQDAAARGTWLPATVVKIDRLPVLPSKRFRNAWKLVGGKIAVDLVLAREQIIQEIKRDVLLRVSASTESMLEASEQLSVLEQGKWKQYRKRLRDLPETVREDLAKLQTAEALLAYQCTWPTAPS